MNSHSSAKPIPPRPFLTLQNSPFFPSSRPLRFARRKRFAGVWRPHVAHRRTVEAASFGDRPGPIPEDLNSNRDRRFLHIADERQRPFEPGAERFEIQTLAGNFQIVDVWTREEGGAEV